VITDGEELRPGVAVPFHESSSWTVAWDQSTGWIRFGNAAFRGNGAAVEYAKKVAVVMIRFFVGLFNFCRRRHFPGCDSHAVSASYHWN
jgi:hypothetical protein